MRKSLTAPPKKTALPIQEGCFPQHCGQFTIFAGRTSR